MREAMEMMLIGLIISATAFGYMTHASWGWMAFGVGLLILGLVGVWKNKA